MTGGLGGVLLNERAEVSSWFAVPLNETTCRALGGGERGTTIYDLELLTTVVATGLLCKDFEESLHVFFGDNDGVRVSLIRANASGDIEAFMRFQLRVEADCWLRTWYARVPAEANISDWPSRQQPHPWLLPACDVSEDALRVLQDILSTVYMLGQWAVNHSTWGRRDRATPVKKVLCFATVFIPQIGMASMQLTMQIMK